MKKMINLNKIGGGIIQLSTRQEKIVVIVKEQGPITGKQIAEQLDVTRASLRPDLAFLTQIGLLEARPRVGYYYSGRQPIQRMVEKIMKLRVKNFKSVPVVVGEQTSVYDCIVALFVNDTGTLFVVGEQGILEGVVSRKDLLKTALGKIDVNQLPVGVIMTRMPNIITTTPEESLWVAARKLITHEIDALPVVRKLPSDPGEKLEVIGRISKTTVTKVFVDLGLGLIEDLGGNDD